MHPIVIGIAGGTGSGKTSVTRRILESLDSQGVAVIAHDAYYRDIADYGGMPAAEINFDHPSALETDLLIRHLRALRDGAGVDIPVYDYATHRRSSATAHIEPMPILIVEGILIFLEKELRDLMDIKIFIDTDADERLLRRMRRDLQERGRSLDSIIHQYVTTVKPMHMEFVEPSKQWADVIIPRGSENTVAIDMVVTKIRTMLR